MAKIAFKPRHFMEMAIEVMRQSVAEARNDGKAAPKVGAVLVDIGDEVPSKSRISTAYRGELREGDHAEFTLLERKNRDQKLDKCFLFATLEPCAPKSRNHPKLGCAERIVLARIKEVWVGIEDPDPTVDRKGIKYLQDHGVTVHMFDRDLQEIIREENKVFLSQAEERAAAAAEEKSEKVVLSPLEDQSNARIEDLSTGALDAFRSAAEIKDAVNSLAFKQRLSRMGLLQQDGDLFRPTGFGFLLFGEEPRTAMPQAALLGTIRYANGKEEIATFDGPQVLVPNQALRWLRDKLPNLIVRTEAQRRGADDALWEQCREGIVNALVHRDYEIAAAKSHLIVTPDVIEIRSPGRPVDPITLEQVQSFRAPMLSRNPVVHYVFAQMKLAEERGLGLTSMKSRAEEAGLPLPRFSWEDPYLVLTLFRSPASASRLLAPDLSASLNPDEREAWEFVTTMESMTTSDLMGQFRFDEKKAQRILKKLLDLKLVRRIGKGRATRYEVNRG